MVADRTFEGLHIVPRPLGIYTCKHHASAAFRTARPHDRACRCVCEMATRHLCSPLVQAGALPNSQSPAPGVVPLPTMVRMWRNSPAESIVKRRTSID